jgi:hypothetical protein
MRFIWSTDSPRRHEGHEEKQQGEKKEKRKRK